MIRRCTCGHLEGDHRSSRTRFPHPLRFGVCLARGCDCREFVERDDEQARADAWLTHVEDEDAAA